MTSSPERISLGCIAFFLATLLGIAAYLEPSPTGFGTHQKLGYRRVLFNFCSAFAALPAV